MDTKWPMSQEYTQHGHTSWVGQSRVAWDFITLLRTAHTLKHKLFISAIFPLIILDRGSPWVTKNMENETVDKRELRWCFMKPQSMDIFKVEWYTCKYMQG